MICTPHTITENLRVIQNYKNNEKKKKCVCVEGVGRGAQNNQRLILECINFIPPPLFFSKKRICNN